MGDELGQKRITAASSRPRRAVLLVSGVLILVGILATFLPSLLTGIRWEGGTVTARRIMKNPVWNSTTGVLRDGQFYWTNGAEDVTLLYTASLKENRPVELARFNRSHGRVLQTLITDTEIWVLTSPYLSIQDTVDYWERAEGERGLTLGVAPGVFGEIYLMSEYRLASPLSPGEHRMTIPRMILRDSRPTTLYRVPRRGGSIRATNLDVAGYQLAALPYLLTEQGVFWVVPRRTTRTVVTTGNRRCEEASPTDDLMFSPADGGKARLWRQGIYPRVSLYAAGDGLYLRTAIARAEGKWRPMVWRLSCTDAKAPLADLAATLATAGGTSAPTFLMATENIQPLELEGRLYWLTESAQADDDSEALPTARVVSCRPDGSDARIIWEGRDEQGRPQQIEALFAHRGRLYVGFTSPGEQARNGLAVRDRSRTVRIARLHPDRSVPLGNSHTLPQRTAFRTAAAMLYPAGRVGQGQTRYVAVDNGCLYVTERREETSPLDFLSYSSTLRFAYYLYRVPLPE